MALSKPDTHIIKRALCYRAKYRTGDDGPGIKFLPATLAVPHPKNRGGEPVVSLRTKALCETICKSGCDKQEAMSAAVAVEQPPKHFKKFHEHFRKQVQNGPGMAVDINGITAVVGTVSHSRFN